MNYMKQVTEMLGVEFEEEFRIKDTSTGNILKDVYRITTQRLERMVSKEWNMYNGILDNVLSGRYEVVKTPYEPKVGGRCWTYSDEDFEIGIVIFYKTPSMLAMMKSGMLFRTENEAIATRPRIYEELTGKKWGDKP